MTCGRCIVTVWSNNPTNVPKFSDVFFVKFLCKESLMFINRRFAKVHGPIPVLVGSDQRKHGTAEQSTDFKGVCQLMIPVHCRDPTHNCCAAVIIMSNHDLSINAQADSVKRFFPGIQLARWLYYSRLVDVFRFSYIYIYIYIVYIYIYLHFPLPA